MHSFVVEESLNSVKVFWLDQKKLIEKLFEVSREVGRKEENVLKIILFGSLAERRAVPGSDADILIILRDDHRPFMERIAEWMEKFSIEFPVEVFPYTQNEINNPMVKEAIKSGVTLFERE
ncbi:MAG: nucleotidyltransferase domain-containing protein [Archaeoglobaceae archaeon]